MCIGLIGYLIMLISCISLYKTLLKLIYFLNEYLANVKINHQFYDTVKFTFTTLKNHFTQKLLEIELLEISQWQRNIK